VNDFLKVIDVCRGVLDPRRTSNSAALMPSSLGANPVKQDLDV